MVCLVIFKPFKISLFFNSKQAHLSKRGEIKIEKAGKFKLLISDLIMYDLLERNVPSENDFLFLITNFLLPDEVHGSSRNYFWSPHSPPPRSPPPPPISHLKIYH